MVEKGGGGELAIGHEHLGDCLEVMIALDGSNRLQLRPELVGDPARSAGTTANVEQASTGQWGALDGLTEGTIDLGIGGRHEHGTIGQGIEGGADEGGTVTGTTVAGTQRLGRITPITTGVLV